MSRRRPRDEFDRFVAETAEGLLRAASLIVWDHAEAEDLVQECFFRVARRWARVRAMEHPRAYARTVLVNLALDDSRRRVRRRLELDGPAAARLDAQADQTAARPFGRVEVSADLVGAIAGLPPRQRAAVVLRYFEDMSEAQAAEAMGCSVGTVKSTTARALERLREATGAQDSQHLDPHGSTDDRNQKREGSTIR